MFKDEQMNEQSFSMDSSQWLEDSPKGDQKIRSLEYLGKVLSICEDYFRRELESPSDEDSRSLTPFDRQRLQDLVLDTSRGDKTALEDLKTWLSRPSSAATCPFVNYHLINRLTDWIVEHSDKNAQDLRKLGKQIQSTWLPKNDSFFARVFVNFHISCQLYRIALEAVDAGIESEKRGCAGETLPKLIQEADCMCNDSAMMLQDYYDASPIKSG